MANNELSDVLWSSSLIKLEKLNLSSNKIKSLEGIPQSDSLRYINFSNNNIKEINGFTFNADYYITADFSNNKINSVNLPTTCKYSKLSLHGNKIEDNSFLESISGNEISLDYSDNLDTSHLSFCNFNSVYILDCPTKNKVEFENIGHKIQLVSSKDFKN